MRPGYITLHSKIYIIGGHFLASDGELLDDALEIYPDLDFAIIDNNNKREEGPPLNGPKPNPPAGSTLWLVPLTLIMAMARRMWAPCLRSYIILIKLGECCPDPPFYWIYEQGDGPRFVAQLVIPPYLHVLIDRPTSYPSQLSAWEDDDIVQSF